MRKKIFLVPILLLFFCKFTSFTKAEFNVNIGDEYHYDVIKWNWQAISGPNSSAAYGFRIDDHLFAEGEDFLVKVLDTPDNHSAAWRIEKDGYSEDHSSSDFGVYINIILLVYSTAGWFLPNLPFNETRILEGRELGYYLFPFHDIKDNYWDYFERRANATYISSLITATSRNYSDIQITFNEKKNNYIFEQYINYDYASTYENISIDFTSESYFLLSVDKSTGVLQGFRAECREFGIYDGAEFDLQSENHIEIKDYNLPKFNLGEYAGLPSYSIYITPLSMLILVTIKLFLKRRRNKNA
jgi:hypothetical protein